MVFISIIHDTEYQPTYTIICYKPKNVSITYRRSKGYIRLRYKPIMLSSTDIKICFNTLMRQEGLDITIPNNMDIEYYNIKSLDVYNYEFELDKTCILTYNSSNNISIDYNRMYTILLALTRYEDENVQKLSTIIMEEIISKIKIININVFIDDVTSDIMIELSGYLSAFCTNYYSDRICYICIALLISIFDIDEDDILYNNEYHNLI